MLSHLNLFCIASSASCLELKSFFENRADFGSISFANDGESAVKDIKLRNNQIFVIEYDKQTRDTNELIPLLRSVIPDAKFIVLLAQEQQFWSTVASGVNAFLMWPTDQKTLSGAIENTVNNGYHLGPCLAKYLFQGDGLKKLRLTGSSIEIPDAVSQLSAREKEVVDLLVEGLTNKEIADALNLKLGTVKVHVNHILAKLKLEHRGQAIAKISRLRSVF